VLKVREGALLHFQLQKSALKVQKSLILHFKDGISNDKLLRLEVTDGRGPARQHLSSLWPAGAPNSPRQPQWEISACCFLDYHSLEETVFI